MKLTHGSGYALHALNHLAERPNGGPVAAHAIARACHIPELFLRKILESLVSAGLLRSARGPGGGYALARPAPRITLLEVVEAVDGALRLRCRPGASADRGFDRRVEGVCGRAADAGRRVLAGVRLSDLVLNGH
jgi:Rrf2 family protein